MRSDALGLFWEDRPPPPRQKIEKIRRIPPDPIWLKPDYLPGLEEALAFPIEELSDWELYSTAKYDRFLFDIECYPNYFLASFRSLATGKVIFFEKSDTVTFEMERLKWTLQNTLTIGFNSLSYDLPITFLAIAGKSLQELKEATNRIIIEGWRGYEVLKEMKVKNLKVNHIDLIEVAPLQASLKVYGGRLHVPRMQDLPFHPDTVLSPEQIAIVRWYNVNSDLTSTGFLYECLKEHIHLRETLSNEIGIDLRSKSDAQIAEAVISEEIFRRTRNRPEKPYIEIGTVYKYKIPSFIEYRTPMMNRMLHTIATANMIVDETGSIAMPEEIKNLKLDINGSIYRMGIGGLHSTEVKSTYSSGNDYFLLDKDVTSYYPFIILNLGLYPKHLGPVFLHVYKHIVDRRLAAKNRGDKVTADTLKITINGSFGKLGNRYSILYSPDLLIQVTLTGQLSLLMLIERLELAGIRVVSANTDGIVIYCHCAKREELNAIISCWERDTNFQTENTNYKSIHSRDVNNYIAVKEDGSTKCKGAYSNPWSNGKNTAERLHKNPTNTICIEAIEQYLINNIPIEKTIHECEDIRKFVSVRTVKGGAAKVWDKIPPPSHDTKEELILMGGFKLFAENAWIRSEDTLGRRVFTTERAYKIAYEELSKPGLTDYLGKSIRWYYAKNIRGEIVYAVNGNKVPRSDNAKPLMDLPKEFPTDVNYDWYIQESLSILKAIGF